MKTKLELTNREWELLLPRAGMQFEFGLARLEVTAVNAGKRRVAATIRGLSEAAITAMTDDSVDVSIRELLKKAQAYFKNTNPANVTLGVHHASIGGGSKFTTPSKEKNDDEPTDEG